MKYKVMFKANVDLLDVDSVINYYEQGWHYGGSNKYSSLVVTLERVVEIEAESDDRIRQYANSINGIVGIDQYISWISCVDDSEDFVVNHRDVPFEADPNNWGEQ